MKTITGAIEADSLECPPEILVEVRGGCVVAMYAKGPAKVKLLDWDNFEDRPEGAKAINFSVDRFESMPEDTKKAYSTSK